MLKVNTDNEYKAVERVYSGSTEIDKIIDKHGNVLFAVNKELEGVPSLTYKGKEETDLKNYRIYGNTVNGESVGDRTGNLFDGSFIHRSVIVVEVSDDELYRRSIVVDISNFNNGDKITFSRETSVGSVFQMYQVSSPLKGGRLLNDNVFSGNSETLLATITLDDISNYPYLMIFLNGAANTITDEELLASKIMVNVGNTPLPYEPYGYRVPVTVTNGNDTETTNLYLPEQIKMVGDEAEYVDYKEQKQHRVRKNLWSGVVEQGAVSQLGDYTNDSSRIRSKNISLSPGTYTVSCNLGIRCIYAYNNSERVSAVIDNGGMAAYRNTFTIPSGANNVSISLRAFNANGTQINNITPSDFEWGQIEKGSEVTNYEPYIEDTELDVTLPALPTLSGTNTLSVGTEVQPSNVYLKGRIKEV